jgi:hypothetical protein
MSRTDPRRVADCHWPSSPHNQDMYSPLAIQVMQFPAERQRPSTVGNHGPLASLARIRADIDAEAERRLAAERDPVQREALRRADAVQRANDAQAAAQFKARMRRIAGVTAPRDMATSTEAVVQRMLGRITALKRLADRAKEARDARLTSYRLIVVSTLTLILRLQQSLAVWRVRLASDRHSDSPPQLRDVTAVISAPRPGPFAGTALAAA